MKYTIVQVKYAAQDVVELHRDDPSSPGGHFVCPLNQATDAERAAILRGLNGPSEVTAKRVAELRSIAHKARAGSALMDADAAQSNDTPLSNVLLAISAVFECQAELAESEADYLEATK